MAFSFKKILSNYFKKSEGETPIEAPCDNLKKRRHTSYVSSEGENEQLEIINVPSTEPDSTSKQCAESLHLLDYKNCAPSPDTDIFNLSPSRKDKRKSKKLKLDIEKASEPTDSENSSNNVENTPKHILLGCNSSDVLGHFKEFDFNKSFDLLDASDTQSIHENDIDLTSERSESDISLISEEEDKSGIKMCHKVERSNSSIENQLVPSGSVESFQDIELDKTEQERTMTLLNYQLKIEKMVCCLKKLLQDFQFHIEVSKIFHCRSIVTTLPGTDVTKIPKILGEVTYLDNVSRGVSPMESWNIILEKEDDVMKSKLKKQLLSMTHIIEDFINTYLHQDNDKTKRMIRRNTVVIRKHETSQQKRLKISNKKRYKHFDFPDIRDAMINLFSLDSEKEDMEMDEANAKCVCKCRCYHRSPSQSNSITKNDQSLSNQSITSSIGNFTLDSSTLSAYSESLDLIVSYSSFEDSTLYSSLLQKAAIERITFYVQVHSIQLRCEQFEDSKSVITFHCPACRTTDSEENALIKHILSQPHCEKIHFLYKTAYIKKCVATGNEIQPSTVLNPMTMYRDDNKIVCFGDAIYACSLCFENLIIGESVLMTHCSELEHIERREKFLELDY